MSHIFKVKVVQAVVVVLFVIQGGLVNAHCHDQKYYIGGGLGLNSKDELDSTGYQFIGGYCLGNNVHNIKIKTAFEFGYMTTGQFSDVQSTGKKNKGEQEVNSSYQGLWVSGLMEHRLEKKLNAVGRIGLDLGDDDGVLMGAGVGYDVSKFSQFRAEYIVRNAVNSFQLNLVSEF